MASISSLSRLKSKMSKFDFIRSRCTDFGNTMSPRWMCQRSTTWAGVLPCAPAMRVMIPVVEHFALRDRRPGLGRDLVLAVVGAHLLVGEVRVYLDLVDCGHGR